MIVDLYCSSSCCFVGVPVHRHAACGVDTVRIDPIVVAIVVAIVSIAIAVVLAVAACVAVVIVHL